MSYYCNETGMYYDSKDAMFKHLRESHNEIISAKKARIYNTDKGEAKNSTTVIPINSSKLHHQIKGLEFDDEYYYVAVNSTNILDSHSDLHLNGIWNKSVKEQQGKVYLVEDHKLSAGSVIVRKEHIEMMLLEIPFSALGKAYDGNTQVLIYKFKKEEVKNPVYSEWLESGDEIQASVRMQYVKMLFALNSNEIEDKEFKKNYDKYISKISNIDEFENVDYFWPIIEAKNILESSLVLFGSNNATGLIDEKQEPLISTLEKYEPSLDTHKQFYLNLLKNT